MHSCFVVELSAGPLLPDAPRIVASTGHVISYVTAAKISQLALSIGCEHVGPEYKEIQLNGYAVNKQEGCNGQAATVKQAVIILHSGGKPVHSST